MYGEHGVDLIPYNICLLYIVVYLYICSSYKTYNNGNLCITLDCTENRLVRMYCSKINKRFNKN